MEGGREGEGGEDDVKGRTQKWRAMNARSRHCLEKNGPISKNLNRKRNLEPK